MTFSTMSMISSVLTTIAVLLNQQGNFVQAASAIDLGDCSEFAVMGGTAVSFNGVTSNVAIGSVGVSPGTSITGAYVISNGEVEANSGKASQCAASMLIAYNAAKGTVCTNTTTPANLGGVTLTSGVFCNAGGYYLLNSGILTLHGSATDVWIFQAATSITTAASTAIVLTGGALASNVFWQAGTTLNTGASSVFVGTVMAGTSITLGGGSVLNGRALAQAAMTCATGNTVTSFVAGSTPSSAPTTIVAGVASTGSSSAQSLSNGSLAAIIVMSFVGFLGLLALVYCSMTRKSEVETQEPGEDSAKIGNFV